MTTNPHANVIEIDNLSYAYPDGTPALRNVAFSVREGESVGLIGPNGAGKSTLILHLNGILPEHIAEPSTVRVSGRAITKGNLAEVRRTVGILFQNPDDQLFCPTVFEDIAFGPKQFGLNNHTLAERVTREMDRVGIQGFEKRSPQHLSRGEKRRVCLAGILACEPRVLVMDEPTTDLDPRGRREFRTLLKQIPVTKIIASHDLELVFELCSRVLVLDKGQLIAQGSTFEILNNEPFMLEHGLERPHILNHRHPHH